MLYVIDGYNVIFRLDIIGAYPGDMQRSREAFIGYLQKYLARVKGNVQILVVFDGSSDSESPSLISYGNRLTVAFSKRSNADNWIRAFAQRSKNKKELTVVSSDKKDILYFARSIGCNVLTVEDMKGRFDKVFTAKRLRQQDRKDTKCDESTAEAITKELYEFYIKNQGKC